jgi:hypothetical protein
MRILWLSAGLLLPLDKGGKLRTWHLLRHLAARHDIEFVAYAAPGQAADVEGMRAVANAVHVVERPPAPPKGSLAFYAEAARYVVRSLPYAIGSYQSAEYFVSSTCPTSSR